MVIFFSICAYLMMNPDKVFEEFRKYQEKRHDDLVELRFKQNPVIEGIVTKILVETKSDRCWIVEMHNGQSSIANLPFIFGSMRYQVTSDSVKNSLSEWDDFNLEQFSIATKLIKDGYWEGTVDDLMLIDKPFAHKLSIHGTESIVLVTLYGSHSAIGFLGVSFLNKEGYKEDRVESVVRRYSYQVSSNIDAEKLYEMNK